MDVNRDLKFFDWSNAYAPMNELHVDSVIKSFGTRQVLTDIFLTCTKGCLLYTSPSTRDGLLSRMPSSA